MCTEKEKFISGLFTAENCEERDKKLYHGPSFDNVKLFDISKQPLFYAEEGVDGYSYNSYTNAENTIFEEFEAA